MARKKLREVRITGSGVEGMSSNETGGGGTQPSRQGNGQNIEELEEAAEIVSREQDMSVD